MKNSNQRRGKMIARNVAASLLALAMCAPMVGTVAGAITPIDDSNRLGANGGKYYSSFSSNEELKAETKKTNIEVVTEGAVLLKNGGGEDGQANKLPYKDIKNVSLFGVCSWKYGYGGTGSGSGSLEDGADIYTSLENAGININPKLKQLYQTEYPSGSPSAKAVWSTPSYGDDEVPISKYTETIKATYKRYNDAAFIFINRLGGEGDDLKTQNVDGRPDKSMHYLELTQKEKDLIKHVEANFDRVVVLFNSGNIIEMGELANDPQIDAIVSIGQTGDYGFDAVLKLIKGEANPSGRTVDIFTRDFTVDPTYQNFGNGSQTNNGSNNYSYTNGSTNPYMEYEEGIYLGYRYYETMYSEIKAGNVDLTSEAAKAVLGSKDLGDEYADAEDWYNKNVVYPFGYGLSYTTFNWGDLSVDVEGAGKDMKFTASIEVENTGDMAGKDVVEIYMNAPYTKGGIEKSAVKLVGFGKTKLLAPGEKQVVKVTFDAYDIAAYDYSDANKNGITGYEIEAGDYKFQAQKNSHDVVSVADVALDAAYLDVAQATGAKIENVFVAGKDGAYSYASVAPTMTILSRGDMVGTFPTAPTAEDRELPTKYAAADAAPNADPENEPWRISKDEISWKLNHGFLFGRDDEENQAWNIWQKEDGTTDVDSIIPANWTQAPAGTTAPASIRLVKMMGIDPYDDETIVSSDVPEFEGKTGKEAWDIFMNQLTYAELQTLNATGFFKTAEIARIGKNEAVDPDGPCTIGGQTKDGYTGSRGPSGTRYWANAATLAATWNQELALKVGTLIGEEGMWNNYNGWYAPSMNTHRSPFSGRNFEYYSQDGVQAGLIAAQVCTGVSSRGVYPYLKHFALNDQETSRGNIATFADEQTIREIYMKPFQYSVEGGGASAIMTGFNRVGVHACSSNYALLTSVLRNEWGFKGHIVTDYQVGTVGDANHNFEVMTRAGNNIPLMDKAASSRGGGEWDPTLRNGMGGVKVGVVAPGQTAYSTTEFLTNTVSTNMQYYYQRIRAMELLYTHCRSNAMDNGADFMANLASQTVTLGAGFANSKAAVVGFTSADDVTYTVLSSNLPEGVTFNASNFSFSATNKAVAGATGTVKIMARYDGWASNTIGDASKNYPYATVLTVKVAEPINYTGATKVAVGASYSATVSQDMWAPTPNLGANAAGVVSVTPSVSGLPEGLTFDAETGVISGTAVKGGEYTLTVNYAVVQRTVNSSGQASNSTTNYKRVVTLTVGDIYTVTVNGVEQKVGAGETVKLPAAPVAPEGKQFAGWFTAAGEKVDENTVINADTVIEAKFEAIPDTIEFRVENGKVQASINGGEWVDVVALEDIKGADGKPGANGAKGDKGDQGPAGPAGADGKDGKDLTGCESVIGAASAIAALATVAGATLVLRKRED